MKSKDKNKKEKFVSTKKIPKLLKKRYTEQNLNKKVLDLITIPQDKELVQSLFLPDSKKENYLRIDLSAKIEKKNLIKLKKIAKDIDAIKPSFKIIPFAAVIIFLVAIITSIYLFKDILLRKVITSGMQSVFEATTDLEYVHLDIMGANLQIKGLQQANSNDLMKNIFEIGNLKFDFNLTELLKGKIDIENVEIENILFNTDRSSSGKVYIKTKKEKKQKVKNSSSLSDSAVAKDLLKKSQNTIDSMFSDYNPETIMKNLEENLKSPVIASEAQELVEQLINKWQDTPDEILKSVNEITGYVDEINKIDWKHLNDPLKIKEVIELVDSGIKKGNSIVEKTNKLVSDIQVDSKNVQDFSANIKLAIENDKKIINSEISKFTVFTDKGLKNTFTDLITAFIYAMLDQYSPQIRKNINKALDFKEKYYDPYAQNKKERKNSQKEKSAKRKTVQRASGRYVYYKNDTVPKFLLENAYGVGPNWSLEAKEFSTDPDKRNKESVLNASINVANTQNSLKTIIDARTQTSAPLIQAEYAGNNIPFDVIIDSYGLKSNTKMNLSFSGDFTNNLFGTGNIDLSQIKIVTPSFEPKIIYDIYKDTIDSIQNMTVKINYDYSKDSGLKLNLNTNAADIFKNAFTASFNKSIKNITEQAKNMALTLLSEKTGIATNKIQEFTNLQELISNYNKTIKDAENQLKNIKTEIENQVKNQTDAELKKLQDAAAESKKQAEAEIKKAEQEAKQAQEEAKRKAEEEAKKAQEEAKRKAEEETKKAEAEAKKKLLEESKKQVKKLF